MTWPESAHRTNKAPGRHLPPIPGEKMARQIENATESAIDEGADLESNELHASGRTCARCGAVIRAGEDVRRTAAGLYQHEVCPLR